MDYRVEWSPEATKDIESTAEYIARDSESRKIQEQALIGRIVPEIGDKKVRERFCRVRITLEFSGYAKIMLLQGKAGISGVHTFGS